MFGKCLALLRVSRVTLANRVITNNRVTTIVLTSISYLTYETGTVITFNGYHDNFVNQGLAPMAHGPTQPTSRFLL